MASTARGRDAHDDTEGSGTRPRTGLAHARLRVLVVDDNQDATELLATWIEGLGHEVCAAHDGREALEAAERFEPHVVLLDIGLPGLDGFEVARRLRKRREGRPISVFAVTGYVSPRDRERTALAGFDAHIAKPIDLDALGERLDAERAAAGL